MGRWIRIKTPDWHCEAKVAPFCPHLATWEEYRTRDQVLGREMPALRCDEHLPSDAIKLEDEAQPMEAAK